MAQTTTKRNDINILGHEVQSIRKMSWTLKVSSSSVAKTIKHYDETVSHEDRHRKGRSRVNSAAEDKFIRVNCTSDFSSSKCFTEFKLQTHPTSTVQMRLRESGLLGQISARKPLLKDTNIKKRLSWDKKHEQWTLDWWKSVLLVWWVQPWDFWFQPLCLCEMVNGVGERIISACVVPTVKHTGGGVMVWGCKAGDTVCDLFRIQGTLNQNSYHSILQRYAIPSG